MAALAITYATTIRTDAEILTNIQKGRSQVTKGVSGKSVATKFATDMSVDTLEFNIEFALSKKIGTGGLPVLVFGGNDSKHGECLLYGGQFPTDMVENLFKSGKKGEADYLATVQNQSASEFDKTLMPVPVSAIKLRVILGEPDESGKKRKINSVELI